MKPHGRVPVERRQHLSRMGFFSRMLFGKKPLRVRLPVFGEATLMKCRQGSYWEVETELAGEPFFVAIETTEDRGPSPAQVAFFEKYTQAPGLAFQRASALLVPEYEKWAHEPFPSDWREAVRLTGLSIPLGGDERNPWDLSFERLKDRGGHLFTCVFEKGEAKELQVDG